MAIVLEEQAPRVGITKIAVWLAVVVAIVSFTYYVFFRRPTLVDVAIPPAFQNTQTLATITLNPEEVTRSYAFQALQQHIEIPVPLDMGREHPFVPFQGVVTSTRR